MWGQADDKTGLPVSGNLSFRGLFAGKKAAYARQVFKAGKHEPASSYELTFLIKGRQL